MVGLLGTSSLEPQCGLIIYPTQAVHTFAMKYPIDILFLDRNRKVVGLKIALRPYRFSPVYWKAEYAVELPAHTISATRTEVGDEIDWDLEVY